MEEAHLGGPYRSLAEQDGTWQLETSHRSGNEKQTGTMIPEAKCYHSWPLVGNRA